MEVKLRVTNGHNSGQVVVISRPRFYIGRADDCQLRPRSDTVSRHHCIVLLEGDWVLVRDLGSKNGTFVNNKRVQPEVELHNGDHLRVGLLEFEIEMLTDIGGKKKPAVHSVQEVAQRTTHLSGPLRPEDRQLDDWLTEDKSGTISETVGVKDDEWVDEQPDQETKSPQDAATDTINDPSHAADSSKTAEAPAGWHKKPASANTRDAASEALKQFLRGR